MTPESISTTQRVALAAEFFSISEHLKLTLACFSGFDPFESKYFLKSSDDLSRLSAYLLSNVDVKFLLDHENSSSDRSGVSSDDQLHQEHQA